VRFPRCGTWRRFAHVTRRFRGGLICLQAYRSGGPKRSNAAAFWSPEKVLELLDLPFNDLAYRAHAVHRKNFDPNVLQLSTLLSIKTGGCPEDCAYCLQSIRYDTGVHDQPLLSTNAVLAAAKTAKENGATRFCMGVTWRGPKERDLKEVLPLIAGVHDLGLEALEDVCDSEHDQRPISHFFLVGICMRRRWHRQAF
jgi:hypothetical protein